MSYDSGYGGGGHRPTDEPETERPKKMPPRAPLTEEQRKAKTARWNQLEQDREMYKEKTLEMEKQLMKLQYEKELLLAQQQV